jgi:transposase
LDRRGLLYVGDGKMAARATRATIASGGDYYLCPLSEIHQFEGELEAALEPVWSGDQSLTQVMRDNAKGEQEFIAEGYEYPVTMRHPLGEQVYTWEERCLVVRSVRHAQAAAAALRARVAKATAQIEALNERGRGKKRFETMAALRRAVLAILKRYEVADFIRFRLQPHVEERSIRAYRGQPARVEKVRDTTVEVEVDEAALEAAARRLGWRLYATNQGAQQLSLEQAVLAYRNEYQVERSLGRLKGRPLSLTPMYVQRDDHATGLIRFLSIALRVLTLLEFVVRRALKADGAKLAGLYAGNAKRETARPTAERLLEAFQDITVTIIGTAEQTVGHVTALKPLQQQILGLLGFSTELYTELAIISPKPP